MLLHYFSAHTYCNIEAAIAAQRKITKTPVKHYGVGSIACKMSNKVTNLVTESFNRKPSGNKMEEQNDLKKPNQTDSTVFGAVTKEFTEDIDILGLKFLCRDNTYLFRKLLYVVLVLFGSGFAIYQIIDQVGLMRMRIYTELRVLFPFP